MIGKLERKEYLSKGKDEKKSFVFFRLHNFEYGEK